MTTDIEEAIAPVEGEYIGLDVGDARIGVARINSIAKIAEPLERIDVTSSEPFTAILTALQEYSAIGVVIGLPRGLDGQETAQTLKTQNFAKKLKGMTDLPVYMIDEAGTSKEAKQNIEAYNSTSLDSISATIILEDFINHKDKKALRV